MTNYARNVNDVAVDVTTTDPTTIYYPTVAAEFIVVPADVQDGWLYDGATWSAPPVPPAPIPVPPVPPIVSAVQFMMLFYPQEQAYIQNSTDAIVKVFWTRFSDQRVTEVNLALDSMSQTLDYLSTTDVLPALTPPAPYLVAGRKEAILTGQAI
jgi:hypothetical protein